MPQKWQVRRLFISRNAHFSDRLPSPHIPFTLHTMPHRNQSDVSLDDVLRAMRPALRTVGQESQPSFGALMTQTMLELARQGCAIEPGDDFRGAWQRLGDGPLAFRLIEAHYQLLTLGYIALWPNTPNAPHMNWFRVTEKGKQWSSSTSPVPEDPDGFLAALNALIPALDPIIKQYVAEAILTYNRQAWFASAVMVGAASEKVVYMLLESLLTVPQTATERQAIKKAISDRNIPKMFEQIKKVLAKERELKRLPYTVQEGSEHHLLSLFEAIRVQRNEAVHPTIGEVTPESLRLTLSAFPSASRKVYDLIEWANTSHT